MTSFFYYFNYCIIESTGVYTYETNAFCEALWFGILGSLFALLFIFQLCSMNLQVGPGCGASPRYLPLAHAGWSAWRRGAGRCSVCCAAALTLPIWSISVGRLLLLWATVFPASIYGESWFVAATWQITILAGLLLTPLLVRGTWWATAYDIVILCIILIQTPYFGSGLVAVWFVPVSWFTGCFAHPLGNQDDGPQRGQANDAVFKDLMSTPLRSYSVFAVTDSDFQL